MTRKYVDCRELPNEVGCSLRIAGEEAEVLRAATEHAISVHEEKASPELTEMLRASLKDENEAWTTAAQPGAQSMEHRLT
jgi:predicted small metal-binding protein